MKPRELLEQGADELGVELDAAQTDAFLRYLDLLDKWNKKFNLTGTKDSNEIVINHFLDSITALKYVDPTDRVLDIGSGAGFPGIPIKIIIEGADVTLIDSVHKKVSFMREVIRELGLSNIKALWGRAGEDLEQLSAESFDVVISRALADIETMIKLSTPYLKPSGKIILMRGKKGAQELSELPAGILRSFEVMERDELRLPFNNSERLVIVVRPVDPG